MTADEWIAQFAGELGVEAPTAQEVEQLLGLAGVAAHASERPAAPITCYLVAKAGIDADSAAAIAARIAATAQT